MENRKKSVLDLENAYASDNLCWVCERLSWLCEPIGGSWQDSVLYSWC